MRLDAALIDDGELPERLHLEDAVGIARRDGLADQPGGAEDGDDGRNQAGEVPHRATLLRRKASRLIPMCTVMPTPTIMHDR